jgi:1,2-diacylglycerol 3-beta-galactosyltransferase
VRALQKYWDDNPPDLVLSVIPHFNRALGGSLLASQIPFVTLLTDLADYPPHFWIEQESQYIICGTDRAKQQALSMGHSEDQVFQTSGMILKPNFYDKPVLDRALEREKFGLAPNMPTAIVLFGGHGSPAMVDIAQLLDQSESNLQLIMLCGHNQKLGAELEGLPTRLRMAVEGFTPRVNYFMALADFFIGKPGPGCISEALQFDLPLIVECNNRTLPQERYNAEWLTEKRLGVALNSFHEIASGVSEVLDERKFRDFKTNARNYSNRALFEVPVILNDIFERCVPHSTAAATFSRRPGWGEPHAVLAGV